MFLSRSSKNVFVLDSGAGHPRPVGTGSSQQFLARTWPGVQGSVQGKQAHSGQPNNHCYPTLGHPSHRGDVSASQAQPVRQLFGRIDARFHMETKETFPLRLEGKQVSCHTCDWERAETGHHSSQATGHHCALSPSFQHSLTFEGFIEGNLQWRFQTFKPSNH